MTVQKFYHRYQAEVQLVNLALVSGCMPCRLPRPLWHSSNFHCIAKPMVSPTFPFVITIVSTIDIPVALVPHYPTCLATTFVVGHSASINTPIEAPKAPTGIQYWSHDLLQRGSEHNYAIFTG